MSDIIRNYKDFVSALIKAGFSGPVGGKDEGAFALFSWGWGAPNEAGIEWHTSHPDTDPWEWRVRILAERDDIAYAKIFYKKAGYITREWYPYFLAARRGDRQLEDDYADGKITHFAKRIYEIVSENENIPADALRRLGGFAREDKAKVDSALIDLQMRMYLTISSVNRNVSRDGKEYGWTTTAFSTPEQFWGEDIMRQAADISEAEAISTITRRLYQLNPAAQARRVMKFIKGNVC